MSSNSLKERTTVGVFWSFIEKFSLTAGQFIISILLARLLIPEDFGLIGMLSIFIALSQVFIDSGMGSGLIQKVNKTSEDFSTVFLFNLVISILAYIILYVGAPFIAAFYENPILTSLTRILSLNLIFGAIVIVQRTKLTIEMDFKTHAKINAVSLFIGGSIGIVAAIYGFGVWSLVFKNLLIGFSQTVGYWMVGNWKFSIKFSKRSFRKLFGYGSNLLAVSLYGKLMSEIYNIIIGRVYTAGELGYYTQTKRVGDLSASTITSILQRVTFPLLSSLQKDKERMLSIFKRVVKMTAFITLPSMTLLALLAEPTIGFLLGKKWLPVVPLLQWYCFVKIHNPVALVNLNMLNASGRSDLFLKVDIAKAPVAIGALLITTPISVEAMVIGQFIVATISSYISAYMSGKLFGYSYFAQIRDMVPFLISTAGMSICVYIITFLVTGYIMQLIVGILVGVFSYSLFSHIFKLDEFYEITTLVKRHFNKLIKI